ncbi:MAG: hypothetical protein Kow0062_10420 [Acidobacteriota bacterium]
MSSRRSCSPELPRRALPLVLLLAVLAVPALAQLDDADGDGVPDATDNCPQDFNPDQFDGDGDLVGAACDCDDGNPDVFRVPPPVAGPLLFDADKRRLSWPAEAEAGSYDAFKGRVPPGEPFGFAHTCHALGLALPETDDGAHPGTGGLFYYLVSSVNCFGRGPLGDGTGGAPRPGPDACPDGDLDGVRDPVDNCPAEPNAAQDDRDFDFAGDACDACPDDPRDDADGDGVCGDVDNCLGLPNPDQRDTDRDGVGDACDPDDDGDSIADGIDTCPLTGNPAQSDRDGDGLGDACDCAPVDGTAAGPPAALGDTLRLGADGATLGWGAVPGASGYDLYKGRVLAGVPANWTPACLAREVAGTVYRDTVPAPRGGLFFWLVEPVNCFGRGGLGARSDGAPRDGPAVCTDADGDGVDDAIDGCPGIADPEQIDVDGDGSGDLCDDDDDGDGRADGDDNCPRTPNPDQADTDGDGTGDACVGDPDGDGVVSPGDVCPFVFDPLQSDLDADGTGDRCDPDDDGDLVPDDLDVCPAIPDPQQTDLDGDGAGDACDPDDDGDGVDDAADVCPRVADPLQADADADGTGDACEIDGVPHLAVARAVHAGGVWLVGTPYEGGGDPASARFEVSREDGPAFDTALVGTVTVDAAPFDQARVLYDAPIETGTLYARVAYDDGGGTFSPGSPILPFVARALPADDGAAGATAGTVEFADPFSGPDRLDATRPDQLDLGGRLWDAAAAQPSLTGQFFVLEGDGARNAPSGSQAQVLTRAAVSDADAFAVAVLDPNGERLSYDFSIGLRASGSGATHRSYRMKVERLTGNDTIKFNKFFDGAKGRNVANWQGDLGEPPWRVRFEVETVGVDAVELRAYVWSGTAWTQVTSFVDDGTAGDAGWTGTPRILDAGGLVLANEKQGPTRYLDVRVGRLGP